MERIIVNTQAELDAIPSDYSGVIEIHGGTVVNPIIVDGYNNARAELLGSSSAELWGSSSAVLHGSSSAVLHGSSSAVLWDSSSAELLGSSRAVLWGSSSAELWGSSSAELWDSSSTVLHGSSSAVLHGSSSAVLWDSSSAELLGSSSAELWDSSSAELWDSSSAELHGSSSAVLWGSSSAELWDSSSAVLHGSSSAELLGSSRAVLRDYSQITKISRTAKAELHDNARCIEPTADIDTFCTFHSIQRNEEKSIWYKAVHKRGEKYIADYNKNTTYTVGKTKAVKNLNTDRDVLCGCGIHIAPLHWAVNFGKDWNDLAILEVEAVTADIVLPYESDGKVRVGKIKVLREVPLDECGLLGKMIAKRNMKESEG